jgi:hypothetical protein
MNARTKEGRSKETEKGKNNVTSYLSNTIGIIGSLQEVWSL